MQNGPGEPRTVLTAAAYRGAALMAKDSDALAYQAAALSETARDTSLRRPDFLERLWRLADLVLLTLAPLRFVPCFIRFPGSAHPPFSHMERPFGKGFRAGLVNAI